MMLALMIVFGVALSGLVVVGSCWLVLYLISAMVLKQDDTSSQQEGLPRKAMLLLSAVGLLSGTINYLVQSMFAHHYLGLPFAVWMLATSTLFVLLCGLLGVRMFRSQKSQAFGLVFGAVWGASVGVAISVHLYDHLFRLVLR